VLADCEQIVADLAAGRPVLPNKQLRHRRCVDPSVSGGAQEFSAPDHDQRADAAGLSAADQSADRPGPSAPLQTPDTPTEN
jgi:hypothetical protein